MKQITTRLLAPESLEARLALDTTFSQFYLQPNGINLKLDIQLLSSQVLTP